MLPFRAIGEPIVATFFFISGYGLMSSLMKKGIKYFDTFFSKRIVSLLKPYLAAILCYQLLRLADGQQFSLYQIGSDLLRGNVSTLLPCWFVITILYLYLCFYFSFRHLSQSISTGLIVSLFFSVIYIAAVRMMNWSEYWYISTLAFNTGLFWKYYENKVLPFLEKKFFCSLTLCLLFVCWYLLRYLFYLSLPETWIFGLFKIAIIPAALTIFLYHIGLPKWVWLVYLGNISYECYLTQGMMHRLLRRHFDSDTIYILITLLCTFGTAAALHWALTNVKLPAKR
jgi:peptidoglycan/LPS O-acetylase OafA/YrhL